MPSEPQMEQQRTMAAGMPNKIVSSFLGNLIYFRLSYSISMAIKKNVKDKTLLPFPFRFFKADKQTSRSSRR